jgi:hypothetical protein
MTDRPATVYKFESFNIYSLLNLKAQSLCFGSPRGFNDPYDCAITATVADPSTDQIGAAKKHFVGDPSIPSKLKQQLESMSIDELKQKVITIANKFISDERENFLNTRGVTCFSERNDDLVMWAHYGGQYKGFCLAFDTAKAPFTKLRRVQYVGTIPQIDIVEFLVYENHDKLLDDMFCTKSISWRYEKEWRAIHFDAGTLFGYEPDALRAIYFGPDIERQALEIICLIIQGQNPDVQFFQGKRSETEFKVEFSNFTYTSHIEAKRKGLI